jgi:hypothetical protein
MTDLPPPAPSARKGTCYRLWCRLTQRYCNVRFQISDSKSPTRKIFLVIYIHHQSHNWDRVARHLYRCLYENNAFDTGIDKVRRTQTISLCIFERHFATIATCLDLSEKLLRASPLLLHICLFVRLHEKQLRIEKGIVSGSKTDPLD